MGFVGKGIQNVEMMKYVGREDCEVWLYHVGSCSHLRWELFGEVEGVGVNVVADVFCFLLVKREGDIGVDEEVDGEGWLGEGINEGGFEISICELLDWRLLRIGLFGVGVL